MNFEQWTEARQQCIRCTHCQVHDDPRQDKPGTILRCAAFGPISGRGKLMYCIDARSEADKCGTGADRFEAAR